MVAVLLLLSLPMRAVPKLSSSVCKPQTIVLKVHKSILPRGKVNRVLSLTRMQIAACCKDSMNYELDAPLTLLIRTSMLF